MEGGANWVETLNKVMNIYCSRKHNTTGMSPHSAEMPVNQKSLRRIYHRIWSKTSRIKRTRPLYRLGDTVRIALEHLNKITHKGYTQNFSTELFTIVKVKPGPIRLNRLVVIFFLFVYLHNLLF